MSREDRSSRRAFVGVGLAAGATALGGGKPAAAHTLEINAMSPTPEQLAAFRALPPDRPIVMVNLLKFKPDGGEAEYAKYGAAIQPILASIGARVIFSGRAATCLIGNADWDAVALVEYPRPGALLEMSTSEQYRAIHHHRAAGLAGQVNYAVVEQVPASSE